MSTGNNPRLWSVQCVIDWLRVRETEGHAFPSSLVEFEAELDHSSLFRRLIEGKSPLPAPPPLSFSQPWYELAERGWATPQTVVEIPDGLVINNTLWKIESKSGERYVLLEGNDRYVCNVHSIGADDLGNSQKIWRITKVTLEEDPT